MTMDLLDHIGKERPSAAKFERIEIPDSIRRRLDELYSGGIWASNPAVAGLLGLSAKWLTQLGNEGRIHFRLKGKSHRQYAREDVEAHLRGETCQSIDQSVKTAALNRRFGITTSKSQFSGGNQRTGFMALRDKRRKGQQKRSKRA
jgi:hypothetical protein